MNEWAVRVEGLSKVYRIGGRQEGYKTFREAISASFAAPFNKVRSWFGQRNGDRSSELIYALKDVSFEIKQGETVGIIGRNGAGKSTLLKILSRITEPTDGFAEIHGRVGSLLEVGTGFHPELSGRENIYLNGAILGMKKAEIERRFDEIVAFAELDKFLDTPVKHYSSGMYVRLAFAVAAHMDTEVLLVDEVLAVGDAAFQSRCLGKMEKIANAGRTVLFVSHNLDAISSLTKRCIYLKSGQIKGSGETRKVVENYYHDFFQEQGSEYGRAFSYKREPFSNSPVQIKNIKLNDQEIENPTLVSGAPFSLLVDINTRINLNGANLTVVLKDSNRNRVAVFFSWDQKFGLEFNPGEYCVELEVKGMPLSPGQYFIDVGVNQSTNTVAYDVIYDFPIFQVVLQENPLWPERPWGAVNWEKVDWKIR